jgi:hypothetical protein
MKFSFAAFFRICRPYERLGRGLLRLVCSAKEGAAPETLFSNPGEHPAADSGTMSARLKQQRGLVVSNQAVATASHARR